MINDEFWSDRFHRCALLAGFVAHGEGRLADSGYVRRLAFDLYEGGAFRAAPSRNIRREHLREAMRCDSLARPTSESESEEQ